MIAKGGFFLTILATCVLSLPVTPSHLENEDVKVIKCIVEVMADVLSRPHPLPVGQECLDTLRTDERLVSILRHRNFLKELQDIAMQGVNERTNSQSDITADHVTKAPQTSLTTEDVADRSMLEALGGPGERSILAEKRMTAAGDGELETTEKDRESQEGNEIGRKAEDEEVERGKDENPDNHISNTMNEEEHEEDKEPDEKKRGEDSEDDDEDEEEKKRDSSEDDEEEEERSKDDNVKQEEGTASKKRNAPKKNLVMEMEDEDEDEEEKMKRSGMFLSDSTEAEKTGQRVAVEDEEEELKQERGGDGDPWSQKSETANHLQAKKKAGGRGDGQEVTPLEFKNREEVPHHSKEVMVEEEEEKDGEERKSPEVKELQMMARRVPEERVGEEEEGSAVRKTEDPEIASLAALESELENVAQKLHKLRRG